MGLFAYCTIHRPRLVAGENVWNLVCIVDLAGVSNWDDLTRKFRTIGYAFFYVFADTLLFCIPARRRRVYYWGFPLQASWNVFLEHSLAQDLITNVFKSLQYLDCDVLPVDVFRLESDNTAVSDRYTAQRDWHRPSPESAKWPNVHMTFCQGMSLDWPVTGSVSALMHSPDDLLSP